MLAVMMLTQESVCPACAGSFFSPLWLGQFSHVEPRVPMQTRGTIFNLLLAAGGRGSLY